MINSTERADELIRTEDVARLLGLTEGTMANQRSRGEGPPFIRIGRAVRYSRRAVTAWIEANTVTPGDAA